MAEGPAAEQVDSNVTVQGPELEHFGCAAKRFASRFLEVGCFDG